MELLEAAGVLTNDVWLDQRKWTEKQLEAIRMGAAALREAHENRWRELAKEKPEENGRYETLNKWSYVDIMNWYVGLGSFVSRGWMHKGDITHWRPVPKGPEVKP